MYNEITCSYCSNYGDIGECLFVRNDNGQCGSISTYILLVYKINDCLKGASIMYLNKKENQWHKKIKS